MKNVEMEERQTFFNRLAELPVSKACLEKWSAIYDKAQQQRVLAVGLKAGEGALKLTGKVASPVINKLPVAALDNVACKQLERLEGAVPVIKKEPKEILEASGQLLSKAKAMPGNTVQAVKDAGYKSVNEVKSYAAETANPTIDRVGKVASYGSEKVSSAKSYSMDKAKVVKDTYDGIKSGELVQNYYNSLKGGVVTRYTGFKEGLVNKYEGVIGSVSGLKTGVVDGCGKAKTELYTYTAETLEPTVNRFKEVKNYGTEKMETTSSYAVATYSGVKNVTTTVVDTVSNSRIVKAAQNTVLAKAINNSLKGFISLADSKVDQMLPAEEGEEDLDPASEDAGSWTKTMILLTKLKGRMYIAGQQRLKPYAERAEPLVASVKGFRQSGRDFITGTYDTTTTYMKTTYDHGHSLVSQTYTTVYNGSTGVFVFWKEKLVSTKDKAYSGYSVTRGYTSRLWTSSSTALGSVYDYSTNGLTYTRDLALKLVPSRLKSTPVEQPEEIELETPVFSHDQGSSAAHSEE